jgi:putative intracellular protease/amidase
MRKTADGRPVVEGKDVTGFTNSEEEAVGSTKVVPFLVEDELKAKGGHFSKTVDRGVHVVSDGLLTTGENPASSGPAAKSCSRVLPSLASFWALRSPALTSLSAEGAQNEQSNNRKDTTYD